MKTATDTSRVPYATQTVPNSTAKHENCPQRTALDTPLTLRQPRAGSSQAFGSRRKKNDLSTKQQDKTKRVICWLSDSAANGDWRYMRVMNTQRLAYKRTNGHLTSTNNMRTGLQIISSELSTVNELKSVRCGVSPDTMTSATGTLNKGTYLILITVIQFTRITHAYDGNNKSS
jgi:hypothetical protein